MAFTDHEINEILFKIVSNQDLHARWLNLLSYLEFIGSRKIFRTQKEGFINESVLKHASDEARHALLMKQMIEKIRPDSHFEIYDPEYMMTTFSGFRYIQSLDSMVKKKFYQNSRPVAENAHICYVYMSYIIEVRANWLYKTYSKVLLENNSVINVNAILNDEVRHLEEMEKEIKRLDQFSQENIKIFTAQEEVHFNRFMKSVIKKIAN